MSKKMKFWEYVLVFGFLVGTFLPLGQEYLFKGIETQNIQSIAIGLGFFYIVYKITRKDC